MIFTSQARQSLFTPKSVAIIGASRSPQKVGYQLAQNLIKSHYSGDLYLINPNATNILNHRVYPTVDALPKVPDMVIVATPAALVIPIISQCAYLGVKIAVVISAGFSEDGAQGNILQKELQTAIVNHPLRLLGPNCLGLSNPYHHLNATFGPQSILPGNIFLISQSGALITSIFDYALPRQMGFSKAVSLGNRIDLNENDFLTYAANDSQTKVIAVYLESFANAREFFYQASQITPHKPIILLKGGSSVKGQQASASHTGALATNATLVSAFCLQTGVLECHTIESWLSSCQLLSSFPRGINNRLGLLSNAGGPGVLTTDFAFNLGFQFPSFSARTQDHLHRLGIKIVHNPLDVLGDASPDLFNQAFSVLARDSNLDSLYAIITPQTMTQPVKIARNLVNMFSSLRKPLAVSFIGGNQMVQARRLTLNAGIPTFDFPNDGIQAFKDAYHYHQLRSHDISLKPLTKANTSTVSLASLIDQAAYFSLLKKYGFNIPKYYYVNNITSIPDALNYVGRPAVAKTADPHLSHKAIVGGVITDLMTATSGRLAFRRLSKLFPSVLYQQTIVGSLELILGGRRDPQFGPFVTLGLGGSNTDIFADRAYFFLPTNQSTYTRLFASTKASALIAHSHLTHSLVFEALDHLAAILLDFPSLQEVEINPLIITHKAAYAVDIKLTF